MSIITVTFTTGKDFIENFKIIIGIMKKENIEKINISSWNAEQNGHIINGTAEELSPFISYMKG